MKIVELHIDGFGKLRNQTLQMECPLVLVYGPNEAGKSTLTNFIRAMLFGFSPRGTAIERNAERYEPIFGGSFGGTITLIDDEQRRVLIERAGGASGNRSSGKVKITFPDGSIGDEQALQELQELLGGISSELFRTLFAFGLSELQELRTLQKDEIGSFLYSAGLGISPSVLFEGERKLNARLDQLYKPRGKNQEMNARFKALEAWETAIRQSKQSIGEYDRIKEKEQHTEKQIGQKEAERSRLLEQLAWHEACLKAREPWTRLRAVQAELAELPEWTEFPEDAVLQWESLQAEHDRTIREWEQNALKLGQLDDMLEQLRPDDRLIDSKPHVETLLERISEYEADQRAAHEWRAELAQVERELERTLRLIDPGWDEDGLDRFSVSAATREELMQWSRRFEELEAEKGQIAAEERPLAREREQIEEELRQLDERLMAVETPVSTQDVDGWEDPQSDLNLLARQYGEYKRLVQERAHLLERMEDAQIQQALAKRFTQAHASGRRGWTIGAALTLALGLAASLFLLLQTDDGYATAAILLIASAGLFAALWMVGRRTGSGKANRRPNSARRTQSSSAGLFDQDVHQAAIATLSQKLEAVEKQLSELQRKLEHDTRCLARLLAANPAVAVRSVQAPIGTRSKEPVHTALEERSMKHGNPATAVHSSNDVNSAMGMRSAKQAKPAMSEGSLQHADWPALQHVLETELDAWERAAREWQIKREAKQREQLQVNELQQRLARIEQQQERLRASGQACQQALADVQAAWTAWLKRHGFTMPLSPNAVQGSLALVEQGHSLLHQRRRLAARIAAAEQTAAAYEAAAAGLLGEAAARDPVLGVKRRGEALAQELRKQEEAARAEDARRAALLEAQTLRQRLDGLQLRMKELLAAAHAESEAELRAHARLVARRAELEGEQRYLLPALHALVGSDRMPQLDAMLTGHGEAELVLRVDELKERLAELTREANELRDLRGRLAGEAAKLEQGAAHSDALQRREEELAALQHLGREYTVHALALHLLRSAREMYERERQPGVLRRASEYFAQMTNGRFSGIRVPFAAERRLEAVEPNGRGVDTAYLSRGTAEQLYLAMRFALAEEYGARVQLPLVMDDILVNFDEERMQSCLKVLERLSERHQIILFTCHRHIRDAAIRNLPQLQVLEL